MMRFGAGELRFARLLALAGPAVAAFAFQAVAQQAPQLPPDEGARIALVDYCVLQESSKHGQYGTYVDTCKCAASRLVKELSQDEMAGIAKWKKPTSAVKGRWDSAWASCQ